MEIEQLTIYEGPVSIDPLPKNDSIVYSRFYLYNKDIFFCVFIVLGIVLF